MDYKQTPSDLCMSQIKIIQIMIFKMKFKPEDFQPFLPSVTLTQKQAKKKRQTPLLKDETNLKMHFLQRPLGASSPDESIDLHVNVSSLTAGTNTQVLFDLIS